MNDCGDGVNSLVEVICLGEGVIGLMEVVCLGEDVSMCLVGLNCLRGVDGLIGVVWLCGVKVLVGVEGFDVVSKSGFFVVVVWVNFEWSDFWIWERCVWILFINLFLGVIVGLCCV